MILPAGRPPLAAKALAAKPAAGGASGASDGGRVVYKSQQLREINATTQVIAKVRPLIQSLINEEGVKSFTVEKVEAAAAQIAKKNTPAVLASRL